MKKYLYVLFVLTLLFSCLTIRRPEQLIDKDLNKDIPVEIKKSIFIDYGWATPVIISPELVFNKGSGSFKEASIKFDDKDLVFVMNENEQISIKDKNRFVSIQKSNKDIYYNINGLGTKFVSVSRYVPRTVFVTEQVQVSRSYPVTRTRQVASYGANGSVSYRTETYTEYETRWETESRTVPKTEMHWETVVEARVDIPEYNYYKVDLDDQNYIYIFKTNDATGVKYFFQNPVYFLGKMKQEGLFGNYDVFVVMADVNSNGKYFDDDDAVLLSAWNPYSQSSVYREVTGYMDNYWYRYSELAKNKLEYFNLNPEKNKLLVKNANDQYSGSDKTGEILINNVPFKEVTVLINGEEYFQSFKGVLKRKIEYGVYTLKIDYEWHVPYESSFLINDTTPKYELNYVLTPEAGQVEFTQDVFRSWTIIITDSKNNKDYYYNKNKFYLAPGNYKFTVAGGGGRLDIDIEVKAGETLKLDYQTEVNRQSGKK